MKTKPQWTQATCLLLQAVDKLHLKPYKWFIWRCGRNLFLISLSLYKGSVSKRKIELRTKRLSAHAGGALLRYLLKLSNILHHILHLIIFRTYREETFPTDQSKLEKMKKASVVPKNVMGSNHFPLSLLNNTNINPHYQSLLSL